MIFLLIKFIHILSSTVLFGTGLGTTFHMWTVHRRRDVAAIAVTARNVVLADWLFTATAGLVQPASGVTIMVVAGYEAWEPWLVVTYGLYLVACGCWLVVMRLQLCIAAISRHFVAANLPLPPAYDRTMQARFWLGWPAFISLIVIFRLMVTKPTLW